MISLIDVECINQLCGLDFFCDVDQVSDKSPGEITAQEKDVTSLTKRPVSLSIFRRENIREKKLTNLQITRLN